MTMKKRKIQKHSVLLKFLQKTKTGAYAIIDKKSLRYARVSGSLDIDTEADTHYYSLS